MAPSAIAEHPLREEVVSPEILELVPSPTCDPNRRLRPLEDQRDIQPAFPFSKAVLLEENRFKSGSRPLKLAESIFLHVTMLSVPIILGLLFTDTINIKPYAAAMLVAAPPPPQDSSPEANSLHQPSFPSKSFSSKRLPWSETVSVA